MEFIDMINDMDEQTVSCFPADILEKYEQDRCYFTEGIEPDGNTSCACLFAINEYGEFAQLLYIYTGSLYQRGHRGSDLLRHAFDTIYGMGIRRVRCLVPCAEVDVDAVDAFMTANGLAQAYDRTAKITVTNQQVRNLDFLKLVTLNEHLMRMEEVHGVYETSDDLQKLHETFYSLGRLCQLNCVSLFIPALS